MSQWICQAIGECYDRQFGVPLSGSTLRELDLRVQKNQRFVIIPPLDELMNEHLKTWSRTNFSNLPAVRFHNKSRELFDDGYGSIMFRDDCTIDFGIPRAGDAVFVMHIPSAGMAGLMKLPRYEDLDQARQRILEKRNENPDAPLIKLRRNEVDTKVAKELSAATCPYCYEVSLIMRVVGSRPLPVRSQRVGLLLVAGRPNKGDLGLPPPLAQQLMGAWLMWGVSVDQVAMVLPQTGGKKTPTMQYDPTCGVVTLGNKEVMDRRGADRNVGMELFKESQDFIRRSRRNFNFIEPARNIIESYLIPTAIGMWGHNPQALGNHLNQFWKKIGFTFANKLVPILNSTYRSWYRQLKTV